MMTSFSEPSQLIKLILIYYDDDGEKIGEISMIVEIDGVGGD